MSISPSLPRSSPPHGASESDRGYALFLLGSGAEGWPVEPLAGRDGTAGAQRSHHPHGTARRPLCLGDRALYDESSRRFWAEVVTGTERQFVAEKLGERNARHKKLGDSRYVVEPNVKEGKGGLRDLHTLYWIGKYIHQVRDPSELVEVGLLTAAEYRAFRRAESFFWSVRCHLHAITGRAEDRLTFDLQREVALRMNFADRPGKSAVERFMQFYFLQATQVGSLTGMFLAQLDEQFAPTKRGYLCRLAGPP